MVVSSFWYRSLYQALLWPIRRAEQTLAVRHPDIDIQVTNDGVATPFMVMLKVVALTGLLLTAPVWLHQFWSFIAPGLIAKERRWARVFVATATPLFLRGVATGYLVMPAAIGMLVSFTPEGSDILNLISIDSVLGFLMRVMLVFGTSYVVPLVILLLNVIGVITAAHMKRSRPFIIVAAFILAAVSAPSTDPFSMLTLALPLTMLLLVTEQVAKAVECRRAKAAA